MLIKGKDSGTILSVPGTCEYTIISYHTNVHQYIVFERLENQYVVPKDLFLAFFPSILGAWTKKMYGTRRRQRNLKRGSYEQC